MLITLLSVEGQRALGFNQTYLHCVQKMNEGLTGLERHFIPLKCITVRFRLKSVMMIFDHINVAAV